MREFGRPGLPVQPGTVVPTSSGALAAHGIRRVYHAAVATPDGDRYRVDPAAITHAVSAAFALARRERATGHPGLSSICFPLLGAGQGGLAPSVSHTCLRWAIEQETAADPGWQVHLVIHTRGTAEALGALPHPAPPLP